MITPASATPFMAFGSDQFGTARSNPIGTATQSNRFGTAARSNQFGTATGSNQFGNLFLFAKKSMFSDCDFVRLSIVFKEGTLKTTFCRVSKK